MSATGLGLAWLGMSDPVPADTSSGAAVSISTASPGGNWYDGIISALEFPFNWVSNTVNSVENTALLAIVILAVLLIAVVALIGFAPNVKHIVPHFV